MSTRIRNHLRSNVIGYIALFLVLTGGTAYALDGSNTVFSDDIVNGEVKTGDLANDGVTSAKILNGNVLGGDLANDAVNTNKIADGNVKTQDLGVDVVRSNKILDGEVKAPDLSSAPPFGPGGFNGDEKIIDGTVSSFDIGQNQVYGGYHFVPNTISESDIADSYGSAGSGTDSSCFDDSGTGEVCASTTFTLNDPGRVLLNATGQWRTFATPPDSMACVLQADGSNVGLAQSFGENGSNHTGVQADGTMALTGLTDTLPAGSHTFQTFCTQTDADIDLLNNQITAARVDG